LRVGALLTGRYRLDEPIATGGMGQVWRATDVTLGRTVAVKVLRPSLLTDPGFDDRFRAEARILVALTHPNVVNIYDYGYGPLANGGGRVAYLVMTYVHGQPLSQRIAAAGRLSVAETMSVVAQAGEALHAAHLGGRIHRDVKPANLVVQPDGMVILVDFGVARSPAIASVTTGPLVLGTANYMAPEQAAGRIVGPATDIYALGAVAFHCLAGQPPFHGDTALAIVLRHVSDEPPRLPPHVPPAVPATRHARTGQKPRRPIPHRGGPRHRRTRRSGACPTGYRHPHTGGRAAGTVRCGPARRSDARAARHAAARHHRPHLPTGTAPCWRPPRNRRGGGYHPVAVSARARHRLRFHPLGGHRTRHAAGHLHTTPAQRRRARPAGHLTSPRSAAPRRTGHLSNAPALPSNATTSAGPATTAPHRSANPVHLNPPPCQHTCLGPAGLGDHQPNPAA
jgi:Protein kinase domain